MTCSEIHLLLQQRLDGEPITDRAELDRHLANCPPCRDLYASAQRLQECLQSLTSPVPPADLSQRILARWLDERRAQARWRRRMLTGVAVAATLLLAVLLGYWRPARDDQPASSPPVPMVKNDENPSPQTTGVSLNQSVQEASSALVALVNRTADETVGQGKVLLPTSVPASPLPAADAWQQTLEPPVESLRVAQQNVALGLEPVTSSARRAVNLFLREMPQ